VAGLSYQERKAKGLAKRAEKSDTGKPVALSGIGGLVMYNSLEFYVDNLTGRNLKVEFVGKVITIKEMK
jgi:hypothetical protein